MTMKAIRIHATGGPEVLRYEDAGDPTPKEGEALVALEAVGVNYIDVYHRTGLYTLAPPPFTPGVEGAGTVETVGPGVTGVRPGDRVAFAGPAGAYAQRVAVSAERLVPVPARVSLKQAAAAMLQGMTAHYLALTTCPLRAGRTCLVHAAAGGVGLLLCQIAHRQGARVIATVSTEAKALLAREAGADEVILYTREDFEAETRRLTSGRGVEVVYDGVGHATFAKSLACLAPRGLLVLFGQASGPVPPFDPAVLSQKGSLFLTRPTLLHYVATRDELLERAGDVLGWIADGRLKLRIDREYPLAEAAAAHRALEGRETTGKLLLIP
jgi:NADPH2:quinone reductase